MMEKFKRTRLYASLTRNMLPKFVCLALAITTWFIVMDNKNPIQQRTFKDVPVDIIGLAQIENRGLIEESVLGDKVDVTVSGTWRNIVKVEGTDIRLSVNLDANAVKGRLILPIDRRINFPGVDIVSLSHDSVEIQLDAIETVAKPVDIKLEGDLPDGFEQGKVEYKENEVQIRGASHILRQIASARGVVDVKNMKVSGQKYVNLVPVDAEGNVIEGVELLTTNVAVNVQILTSKEVPLIVLDEGEPDPRYRLTAKTPSVDKVRIKGDTQLLEKIKEVRSKPVNIDGLFKPFEAKIELDLPAGIEAIYDGPLLAKINIQALDRKYFYFKYKDVVFENQNTEYTYVFDGEKSLTLEVRDIISVIRNINQGDIKLILDVKEVTPGTYSRNIKVEGLPEGTVYTIADFDLEVREKASQE